MNSWSRTARFASLLAILSASGATYAIDYNPTWPFDQPIGQIDHPSWFDRDYLTYDARTGELIYSTGHEGRWSPPDLASRSGSFLPTAQLPPVPLAGVMPSFGFDETIGGIVVPGSNGIHISFDPYIFWPFGIQDPVVLSIWGLTEVPTSYKYGAVLPPGLSETFLLNDLHAAVFPESSYVQLIYLVPEPRSLILFLIAVTGIAAIRRQRRAALPAHSPSS